LENIIQRNIVSLNQILEVLEGLTIKEEHIDCLKEKESVNENIITTAQDEFLPHPNVLLNVSNTLATSIAKSPTINGYITTLLGKKQVLHGTHCWKMKILITSAFRRLMIGIAPPTIDTKQINNYKNGWFFSCKNGTLYSNTKNDEKFYIMKKDKLQPKVLNSKQNQHISTKKKLKKKMLLLKLK